MNPKTKFIGKTNPFTGEPKLKRVFADTISITNDPMLKRRVVDSKYDQLFSKLKTGQSLRVPSKSTSSIAQALRKYLEKSGIESKGRIKLSEKYPGDAGFGRVWLMGVEK